MAEHITHPKVTVFMAVFNTERYVSEAIKSILSQTFKDFELLIVDDGSTDSSEAIIKGFKDKRIRLLSNLENKGLLYTRNLALEHAHGKYIAILDSDDIAFPSRLQLQFNFMETHPDIALCGGHATIIDSKGHQKEERFIEPIGESVPMHALFGNPFINSSTMFKTSVFKELNGYRNYAPSEDFELFLRMAERYPITNIDHELVKYRIHDYNISKTQSDIQRSSEMRIIDDMHNRLNIESNQPLKDIHFSLFSRKYSTYSFLDFYTFLILLKDKNQTQRKYDPDAFNKLLFNKWLEILTAKKAGRKTLSLFFKRALFSGSKATFKQFRRAFKQSIKGLFGA